MQKNTVFLLQDTNEKNQELHNLFAEDGRYEVIGSATDGLTGLGLVEELKPAFVLTEIVLSRYDGLCVIEKIREKNLAPYVIVLSALCREEIISKAIKAGAQYFMVKPYNFRILLERMEEIGGEKQEDLGLEVLAKNRKTSLDEKISNIFINVGIPPHIKGYSFLREGVKMAVDNPEIINNITKKLYPMIGKKYSTTASKVERAIRHAIEVAWNRGRIENINNILGVRAYVGAEKPTNGEFIALVADKMLLEKA